MTTVGFMQCLGSNAGFLPAMQAFSPLSQSHLLPCSAPLASLVYSLYNTAFLTGFISHCYYVSLLDPRNEENYCRPPYLWAVNRLQKHKRKYVMNKTFSIHGQGWRCGRGVLSVHDKTPRKQESYDVSFFKKQNCS